MLVLVRTPIEHLEIHWRKSYFANTISVWLPALVGIYNVCQNTALF
jgi:hypothetical protein